MALNREALRRREQEVYGVAGPYFDLLRRRARECILWHMSPDYWDSMSQTEHKAWLIEWNELQKEGHKP